ncbi:MAG: alkaline phosphatase family protein [Phycisphaerales bacterium]|nr:alkaline phosphatase family protein [Phycisphaerales bacterium]
MRIPVRVLSLLVLIVMTRLAPSVRADDRQGESPRLVVIVVIDQLRADYLTRFEPWFGDDGFRRLFREGAHFANAHFTSSASATAPGHATIATGANPRVHGIVGNKWFMDTGTTQSQYAVYDDACDGVPSSERGGSHRSPRRLGARTLGDQMKLADRRTRVVSIALKDRAAIFLGGRLADTAIWWDFGAGKWVSSSFYGDALPAYVTTLNNEDPTKRFAGYVWRPLTPESAREGAYPLETAWHPMIEQLGLHFPHALPERNEAMLGAFHDAMTATPAGIEVTLDLVERAIAAEELGRDDVPDLLCVGFSSNDLVGHFFGPQSAEVMDMTVQTDRQIARLLEMLDKQVGPDRYILALAADHGVAATPEVTRRLNLPGGLYDPRQLGVDLNGRLQAQFFDVAGAENGERLIVVGVEVPWIYFNMPLVNTLPVERRKAFFDSAVDYLRAREFITDAFGPDTLAGAAPPESDMGRLLAWNSWNPENAGQVCLQIRPGWKKRDANLAGHNGGSAPERHVPILLRAKGIAPGRYHGAASPCDIVVTLSALLGIEPPNCAQGRVLSEAIPPR